MPATVATVHVDQPETVNRTRGQMASVVPYRGMYRGTGSGYGSGVPGYG